MMTKKTESLELRLSPELKEALSDVSKSRGAPMSQIVRSLVEREVNGGPDLNVLGKETIMTKRTLNSMFAAGACVLAIAGLSLVAETSPLAAQATARMAFAEFDLDGDGKVTQSEFDTIHAEWEAEFAEFAALIEDEEFAIPAPCVVEFGAEEDALDAEDVDHGEDFDEYDLNNDGVVNLEEVRLMIEAELTEEFLELDRSGDGLLDQSEVTDTPWTVADYVQDGVSIACAEALVAQEASIYAEGAEDDEMTESEARVFFAGLDQNMDGRVTITEFIKNN